MRAALILSLMTAVLLCTAPTWADEWAYVYGGVDDPTSTANKWVLSGVGSTPAPEPVWNLDTGLGTKAIKVSYSVAEPGQRYYVNNTGIDSGHKSATWHSRFKIVGGAPVVGAKPYFLRGAYLDGRSRVGRRSDGAGGTGDDFVDADFTSGGAFAGAIAPYDDGWHELTIVTVGNGQAPNAGSYEYWDGHFALFRPPGLTGNQFAFYFGLVSAVVPDTGYPDVDLWVDYFGWGYDDDPDENGNLGWFEIMPDSGTCSAVGAQTVADETKKWTENEWAGQWLIISGSGWYAHRIAGNTATDITIESGDLLTEGVGIGNNYRIIRDQMGDLPGFDPDQVHSGNRLVNVQFDSNAGGTAQPTGWQCYPEPTLDWAVQVRSLHNALPHQTNRMYGGAFTGDAQSEPRDYYIYQTYATKSPEDQASATYYASVMALTLSEGGDPSNSKVRVGIGQNLSPTGADQYDPTDPAIQWGEWVSTQGYPWRPARSAPVTLAAVGNKLTVFVHMNQQEEFDGKIAMTFVDSAWLNTTQYPWIHNISWHPLNADCTDFRVEWDTDLPGNSLASFNGSWRSGPNGVTKHYADGLGLTPSTAYAWSVKTDEVRIYDFPESNNIGTIRTGPDLLTPNITSGPDFDAETATITWQTDVPTTTVVEFNPRGVGDLMAPIWIYTDEALTTDHVAMLNDWSKAPLPTDQSPMMPGDMIWFRVKGRNSTVAPAYKYFYSACQSQRDLHTGKFRWIGQTFTGSVGELKNKQVGTIVDYTGKVVTGSFTSTNAFSYIEEPDRSSGIKIAWDASLERGDVVSVKGILQNLDGEKQILASDLAVTSNNQTVPEPIGMTGRTIAAAGDGAQAQGLLVMTCGRVTYSDFSGGYFYLDDGSGCLDGTTHDVGLGPEPNAGIRVYAPTSFFDTPYAVVRKGCVGTVNDGGTIIPVIWVMNTEDVEVVAD